MQNLKIGFGISYKRNIPQRMQDQNVWSHLNCDKKEVREQNRPEGCVIVLQYRQTFRPEGCVVVLSYSS